MNNATSTDSSTNPSIRTQKRHPAHNEEERQQRRRQPSGALPAPTEESDAIIGVSSIFSHETMAAAENKLPTVSRTAKYETVSHRSEQRPHRTNPTAIYEKKEFASYIMLYVDEY